MINIDPSHYIAVLDSEACSGCALCIERCQAKALKMEDDTLVLHLERCIGCGLCVSACPLEAITLVEREESQKPHYPSDWADLTARQHGSRDAGK